MAEHTRSARNVLSALFSATMLVACGSARPAPIARAPRERASTEPREVECARASVLTIPAELFTTPPEQAALDRWIAAHGAEVEASLAERHWYYEDRDLEVRARHVLVRAAAADGLATRASARARAQDILEQAIAGEDFAALAIEHSEDPGSAERGGDLGWNPRGRMVRPFDDAMFSGAPGVYPRLIESEFGYHVLDIVGRREGDVPRDQALQQEGERLAERALRMDAARQAAQRAIHLVAGHEQTIETVGRVLVLGHEHALDEALTETELFGRGDELPLRAVDPSALIEATLAIAPGEVVTTPIEANGGWLVVERTDREVRRTGRPPRCTTPATPADEEDDDDGDEEESGGRPPRQDDDVFRP